MSEAEREAERRSPLWLPTGDYEIDREDYSELDARWQNEDTERDRAHFVQGAEWQAERDAVRIAELEAEIEGIKRRDAEVGEDEGWWIGGAWGDYGEAVVPLRILSYVIDGNLDEKVTSIDPGFALTYAEQTARADDAEAKINAVRELHQPARLIRGDAEFCHECTDPWPCRTARALEERTDT